MTIWQRYKWIWSSVVVALALVIVLSVILVQNNQFVYVNPHYGPIVEAIYGLGKVKTDRVYEVKLGVTKIVKNIFVNEGATVRKGDQLVRFDGDLLFSAPFDGVVTFVALHEDLYVFPQQPVIRIEDLDTKYIEVSLEQQGALRVQPGLPVRVVFESIRGEVLKGKVLAIFSRNEEFLAHIEVPLAGNVLPGMTADVAIEVSRRERALLIPLSSVSDGRVKLRRNGKRITMKLKIGSIDGNWAEVIEGDIRETDEILIRRRDVKGP